MMANRHFQHLLSNQPRQSSPRPPITISTNNSNSSKHAIGSGSGVPSFHDLAAAALCGENGGLDGTDGECESGNSTPTHSGQHQHGGGGAGPSSHASSHDRHSSGASDSNGGTPTQQGANGTNTNGTPTVAGTSNRTARACSWCRRRKRKCDGARPTCCWCAKGNLACNYPSTLLKRGPQSGMMKKLKTKVEELEQQLNSVRVVPSAVMLNADGSVQPTTMSITSFLHRIRSSRAYHDATLAALTNPSLTSAQTSTLQTQSPTSHVAIRDRLYLTSFLCSFNEIFPLLDHEWESTYMQILLDDAGQFEPPLYWTFQYSSAIALGALIHGDALYANESASVARHAASTLFDEAHSQVLRGLLLLSFVLIGLGQHARASCYIAVANRMVYLLTRPPCIDPHIPNSTRSTTSLLAFPGTLPDARVPLALPPTPATNSSHVTPEVKLMYSLLEDMSNAAHTFNDMVCIGFDKIERCIVENKKRLMQKVTAVANAIVEQPNSDATSAAAGVAADSTAATTAAAPSVLAASLHASLQQFTNDHLLTLGLDCRHNVADIFDECAPQVEAWQLKAQQQQKPQSTTSGAGASSTASPELDLSVAHTAFLRLFVFLTSFRGDFMQIVRPSSSSTQSSPDSTTSPPSTALSLEAFEISLANTRKALRISESLCDVLSVGSQQPKTSNSNYPPSQRFIQHLQQDANRLIQPLSSSNSTAPSKTRLRSVLTQASTQITPTSNIIPNAGLFTLAPLHLQSSKTQLHALALLLKSVLMHMVLLSQESDSNRGMLDAPSTTTDATSTTEPPPRLIWSNVILSSNTATSYIETHKLDLTYCAFFALLVHLNIQIKLKYVKQCMASWKRSQNWQFQHPTVAGSNAPEEIRPTNIVTLTAATQSLLDSLHYLHMDYILLDNLNLHWSSFTSTSFKDAQERIAELLNYLRLPVDGANADKHVDGHHARLVEEGTNVFQTITQRYPLFTAGQTIAKLKSSMVSATLLGVPSPPIMPVSVSPPIAQQQQQSNMTSQVPAYSGSMNTGMMAHQNAKPQQMQHGNPDASPYAYGPTMTVQPPQPYGSQSTSGGNYSQLNQGQYADTNMMYQQTQPSQQQQSTLQQMQLQLAQQQQQQQYYLAQQQQQQSQQPQYYNNLGQPTPSIAPVAQRMVAAPKRKTMDGSDESQQQLAQYNDFSPNNASGMNMSTQNSQLQSSAMSSYQQPQTPYNTSTGNLLSPLTNNYSMQQTTYPTNSSSTSYYQQAAQANHHLFGPNGLNTLNTNSNTSNNFNQFLNQPNMPQQQQMQPQQHLMQQLQPQQQPSQSPPQMNYDGSKKPKLGL